MCARELSMDIDAREDEELIFQLISHLEAIGGFDTITSEEQRREIAEFMVKVIHKDQKDIMSERMIAEYEASDMYE